MALIGAHDIGTALLYDLSSGEVVHQFVHMPDIGRYKYINLMDVDISPDGRTALTVAQNAIDGTVLWDLATGSELHRFKTVRLSNGVDNVSTAVYSPDGSRIVVGLFDGTLALYDLQTFNELLRFGRPNLDHAAGVMDVTFSLDGRSIISASQDSTLIQWDAETGALLRRFTGHTNEVRGVAFSPDGSVAVSVSADSTIIVWDVASGQAIRRYSWPDAGNIFSVAFSPDGRSILAAGGNGIVSLWRVEPALDDLLAWIDANRFVPEPTSIQRQIYGLSPLSETIDR